MQDEGSSQTAAAPFTPVDVTRAELDAWLQQVDVSAPPADIARSAKIIQLAEHVFASRCAEAAPYDFENLMEEFWAKAQDGDWLIGVDGHGIQSWAFHWVQRRGPVLLGFQRPVGGAFAPSDLDREAIEGAFALTAEINVASDRLLKTSGAPDDRVLVILDTTLEDGRYGWIEPGGTWSETAWQDDPMAAYAALMELERLGKSGDGRSADTS